MLAVYPLRLSTHQGCLASLLPTELQVLTPFFSRNPSGGVVQTTPYEGFCSHQGVYTMILASSHFNNQSNGPAFNMNFSCLLFVLVLGTGP